MSATVKTGTIFPANPRFAMDGMATFQEVMKAVNTWVEVRETERTKRTAIAAQEAVALAEIAAKRDVFLTYLNRSCDERRIAFDHLFDTLDHALATGSADLGSSPACSAQSPPELGGPIDRTRPRRHFERSAQGARRCDGGSCSDPHCRAARTRPAT